MLILSFFMLVEISSYHNFLNVGACTFIVRLNEILFVVFYGLFISAIMRSSILLVFSVVSEVLLSFMERILVICGFLLIFIFFFILIVLACLFGLVLINQLQLILYSTNKLLADYENFVISN